MVSKVRVTLIMLALTVPAMGMIPLLMALDAADIWFKILIPGVYSVGAVVAESLGWFKKPLD